MEDGWQLTGRTKEKWLDLLSQESLQELLMDTPQVTCACRRYCPICLAQMIARICAAEQDQFHPAAWTRKSEILDELYYLCGAPFDPSNLMFLEFVRRICYAARY